MSSFHVIANLLRSVQTLDENEEVELKKAANELPKSFWETYSAFANTAGGVVLLGITEDSSIKITGVDNAEKIKKDLFNTVNNPQKVSHCVLDNDDVREHNIDGKIVISIHVHALPATKKPLYLNGNIGNAYIRKNESDCRINKEDLRRFIRNSEEDSDTELLDNYILDDLNLNSVLSFKNIVDRQNPSRQFMRMDNLRFLTEMGVFRMDIKDGHKPKLTLAGLLFLGKLDAIQQRISHFHLDYINRRGLSTINRWRDRVSTGDIDYSDLNLFEFYRIVREKLRITVEDKFELDEKSVRKPSSELNIALREALANTIIHADYLDSDTEIKIIVDDLYYTFQNPGSMKITEAEFFSGGYSKPRNNLLIQYFRRMGESERAGTGGREIYNVVLKNEYRAPNLFTDLKSTRLKIWRVTPLESCQDLSEPAQKVLKYIYENSKVARSDIKKNCALSDHYARKAIDELLKNELIVSIGRGRATYYCRAMNMIDRVRFANELRDAIIQNNF